MKSEKQYLDSLFGGFSVDSLPIKDTFGKCFATKNFKIFLGISNEQLNQACKRFDCSEEILFMSAYGLLLARFAGADEVLFAATGTKKIPVAVTFSLDQNISDLIKNLRDQIAHAREVLKTSYEKIAETYNFPNLPEFLSTQQENGDKTFALAVEENFCCVSIGFDGGKYSEPLIESFAAAYKHVIAQFLNKEKISDIDWLSADELAKVKNIHDTAWEVVERPAYRLLQDSAEKFPEHVAAIANGKSLTYAELNTAANRLGHVLQDNGVGVEKIVAVMLNRGLEVYIARQGILKAGGAFLPMTPDYPDERVNFIVKDPIGALGEMTIIGDGVGRGYVNRDDLTKKNFIKLWNKPAYKSGDLARLLPNGEIAFHGRTDNQVKLRGLRVELGEIEAIMNNFDGVKASIVVVKKNSAGNYLAGYFTAEKQIDLDELKKHLAASDILTQINVEGVQNLINLCVRKKARLIQISTVSIAGDNVDQKIPMGTKLAENDFYIGQNVTSNKYVYSKFQAEEIVLAAVGQGELDAKIYSSPI